MRNAWRAVAGLVVMMASGAAAGAAAPGGSRADQRPGVLAEEAADGPVVVRYGASHWDGTPAADFAGTKPDATRDVVRESGWWLRIDGIDAAEIPFPAPSSANNSAPALLQASWGDLRRSGLVASEDATASNAEGPSGTYVSRLLVKNDGAQARRFSVFHYLDPDPSSSTFLAEEGAAGVPTTPNMIVVSAFDAISGLPLGQVNYRAGGADRRQCGSDALPVRNVLNDADVDDLDNTGLPAPPRGAGVTCAYEWKDVLLPPSELVSFVVAVSSGVPRFQVKGDYDGDNLTDLLLESGPFVSIWQMLRTQFRDTEVLDPSPLGPVVAVDDFDRDFENDLLFRDPATGQVSVSFRHSRNIGSRQPLLAPAVPLNWRIVTTADFNHDGYADILWRNDDSQNLVAWLMNGLTKAGSLVPNPPAAVDANWDLVGANDVNRDGQADFVWYNTTSGNTVVWYLDAALNRVSGAFTTPPSAGGAGWRVVATGDYGRGASVDRPAVGDSIDLVWQNTISARVVVWHMNFSGERTSGELLFPGVSLEGFSVFGPR